MMIVITYYTDLYCVPTLCIIFCCVLHLGHFKFIAVYHDGKALDDNCSVVTQKTHCFDANCRHVCSVLLRHLMKSFMCMMIACTLYTLICWSRICLVKFVHC